MSRTTSFRVSRAFSALRLSGVLALFGLITVPAGGCAASHAAKAPGAPQRAVTAAIADLYPTRGSKVHGLLHFRTTDQGLLIRGSVTGLLAGLYGFGIHEKGDCSSIDGKSAGAYFQGTRAAGAEPLGRLENLTMEHPEQGDVQRLERSLSLTGPDAIVGRSVVIEAWAFDPNVDPARVPILACGVIRAD
jgi:Cu-Zn family superoxide dismutase